MNSTRSRFPRLNLARSGIVRLVVHGAYESTDDLLALLPTEIGPSPGNLTERGAFNFTRYTTRGANNASYGISAMAHSDSDEKEIHVSISYQQIPREMRRRPRSTVSEHEFLRISEVLGEPKEAGGRVLFDFDDLAPSRLWFPLPVGLAGSLPEEIIEIRGVRGAKLGVDGVSPVYEFILDRGEGQDVALQLEIGVNGIISGTTIQRLSDRAIAIARELVADA